MKPELPTLPPELVVLEQLLELRQHLQEVLVLHPGLADELQPEIERLDAVMALLEDPTAPAARVRLRSKVERLGLGGEVLRLRESGCTYEDIAARYPQLSAECIARFCRAYERLAPKDQLRVRRRSVFDTRERLEDISAMLYRLIARLELSQSDEVLVKAIAELRQTAALAQQVTKDMLTYAQYQRFKQDVLALIAEYVPADRRPELLQRIAAYTQLQQDFPPPRLGASAGDIN